MTLNLDAWFDEPDYKAAMGSLSRKGTFILRKVAEHDAVRFNYEEASVKPSNP